MTQEGEGAGAVGEGEGVGVSRWIGSAIKREGGPLKERHREAPEEAKRERATCVRKLLPNGRHQSGVTPVPPRSASLGLEAPRGLEPRP